MTQEQEDKAQELYELVNALREATAKQQELHHAFTERFFTNMPDALEWRSRERDELANTVKGLEQQLRDAFGINVTFIN